MWAYWVIPVFASILILGGFGFTQQSFAATTFFGPTPYLSTADIPVGFYGAGSPTALEDFEDGTLDFGIIVTSPSGASVVGMGSGQFADSVDFDDGVIDGDNTGGVGHSNFIGGAGSPQSVLYTFPFPVVEAGLVWTDGDAGSTVIFEAFGPGGSLGTIGPFSLADGPQTGETAEDSFFGVKDPAGIIAIKIIDSSPNGAFEIDHVQYGAAFAVTLSPGDIIIADLSTIDSGCAPSPGCGGLIKVDPTTGVQTAIASGGFFFNPFDVEMDANGDLIVAEPNGNGGCPAFGCGAIFRVDPSNGDQFLISSLGDFFDPLSIEIDANGDFIVLDMNAFPFLGALFNITPADVRTTITSGGFFGQPQDLAIESDGNFVIADIGNFPHIVNDVLRVTPGGAQSVVSSGGDIDNAFGVAIDINGDIIVVNSVLISGGTPSILRIDPSTGAQSTISSGDKLTNPLRVAIDANGDYLVTDTKRVIKVDRTSGAQSVLSSGQLFDNPTGIFVVPEEKKSCDALDKASENGKGKKKGLDRAKANNNCS